MAQQNDPDLTAALEAADAAFRRGDLAAALIAYEQVLAMDPENVVALSRRGAILAQRGDLAGAEDALRRALAIDPSFAPAHSNLGNVHYQRGEYTAALERYQKAAALDPTNPVFHDNLHAAYKKLGQVDRAVAAYKRARALEREALRAEARQTLQAARRRLGCGAATALLTLALAATLATWFW